MNREKFLTVGCVVAMLGVVAIAIAQEAKTAGAAAEAPQLPPGWTADDMKAMVDAATPGKMHEVLAK